MEQGHAGAGPSQRQSAVPAEEDHRRAHRGAGDARIRGTALCREMVAGTRAAEALGCPFRREVSGPRAGAAALIKKKGRTFVRPFPFRSSVRSELDAEAEH